MSTDYKSSRTADPPGLGRNDGSTVETRTIETGVVAAPVGVALDDRDPIRWGPILAGVVTALAVMLFLTALGLALGFSVSSGDESPQDWGTAAGIWGGLSLLASFFFGGWMAGRGSAPGPDRFGLINGFVTGAATLLLIFWLAATTLTGALGFVGSTAASLGGSVAPAAIEAVADQAPPVDQGTVEEAAEDPAAAVDEAVPEDVQQQAEEQAEAATQQAEEVAGAVADAAGPSAWGTFFAILLALAVASIGGMLGQAERRFVPGSRVSTTV